MVTSTRSVIDTRFEQMFPTLEPAQLERLRHFGEPRSYAAGERLVGAGEISPGMIVILSGAVAITQPNALGYEEAIVTHGPGSFMGELAQLSGQPSLVDARAISAVQSVVIPSRRLPEVMVAEAELGEHIMRALILRRVGLIQSAIGGPLIVGRAAAADVLRLASFLGRNGHPYRILDPDADAGARALLERFHVEEAELPIILCPNGSMLKNPGERALADCLGLVRSIPFHRFRPQRARVFFAPGRSLWREPPDYTCPATAYLADRPE